MSLLHVLSPTAWKEPRHATSVAPRILLTSSTTSHLPCPLWQTRFLLPHYSVSTQELRPTATTYLRYIQSSRVSSAALLVQFHFYPGRNYAISLANEFLFQDDNSLDLQVPYPFPTALPSRQHASMASIHSLPSSRSTRILGSSHLDSTVV